MLSINSLLKPIFMAQHYRRLYLRFLTSVRIVIVHILARVLAELRLSFLESSWASNSLRPLLYSDINNYFHLNQNFFIFPLTRNSLLPVVGVGEWWGI